MTHSDSTKVALVTGASPGGLGFYIAKSLKRQGYRVFATTRKGNTTIPGLEGCDILQLDVTDDDSVKAAAREVERKAGALDVVVNNAGQVGSRVPLLDASFDNAKATFEANFWGPLRVIQAFVPLMLKDGLPARGAKRVVNVGSVLGTRAVPWVGIYASSKHAVQGLGDALRLELAGFNVSVTTVDAGLLATNIKSNASAEPLPASSLYRASWDAITKANIGLNGPGANAEHFAESLVSSVIGSSNPPKHYYGGKDAWLFHRVFPYSPTWFVDKALSKNFGAGEVKLS